jgi:hypothetical protein
MLYPSTLFRLNGIRSGTRGQGLEVHPEADCCRRKQQGRYRFPAQGRRSCGRRRSGIEWRVNLTQLANRDGNAMDGTDAREAERGRGLGRRQIASVAGFLREVPGFEQKLHRGTSRRRSVNPRDAAGMRGPSTGAHRSATCWRMRRAATTPIGVNGVPLDVHHEGRRRSRWPEDSTKAGGFIQLPYRHDRADRPGQRVGRGPLRLR